jgi:hypothetical protein
MSSPPKPNLHIRASSLGPVAQLDADLSKFAQNLVYARNDYFAEVYNRSLHAGITKLQVLVADLITLPQTKEITCISATEFRRLKKASYIREFLQMTIGGKVGPKCLASDVRELVCHFRAMTERRPSRGMRGIGTHCRAERLNLGDLLIATLEGRAKPSAMHAKRTGLLALCFYPSHVAGF